MYLDEEINESGFNKNRISGKNFQLDIMKKAMDLLEIIHVYCHAMEADDTDFTEDPDKMMIRHTMQLMQENAAMIPGKIAGTEGMEIFSHKMENAVLIKRAATDIRGLTSSLAIHDSASEPYLELIRRQVDDFQPVFVEWVKGFDRSHDISDGWGIFFV